MRVDQIQTPEQLVGFLKADKYWYSGFNGELTWENPWEFTFLVQVTSPNRITVRVNPDHRHVCSPMDLTDTPEDAGLSH